MISNLETFNRLNAKDDMPRLWEHNGKTYASNLFKLHDQEGFSLADSLIECNKLGWIPCLDDFRACALRAGWSRERIDHVVAGAQADSVGMP